MPGLIWYTGQSFFAFEWIAVTVWSCPYSLSVAMTVTAIALDSSIAMTVRRHPYSKSTNSFNLRRNNLFDPLRGSSSTKWNDFGTL